MNASRLRRVEKVMEQLTALERARHYILAGIDNNAEREHLVDTMPRKQQPAFWRLVRLAGIVGAILPMAQVVCLRVERFTLQTIFALPRLTTPELEERWFGQAVELWSTLRTLEQFRARALDALGAPLPPTEEMAALLAEARQQFHALRDATAPLMDHLEEQPLDAELLAILLHMLEVDE